MLASRAIACHLSIATVVTMSSGCFGEESAPADKDYARPRAEDPPLTHTWNIPKESSRVTRGDAGSKPPELAEALMQGGALPSLVHRTAQSCLADDVMTSGGEIALRFGLASGKVSAVQGDPKGPASECFAKAFGSDSSTFASVPDGFALVRLMVSGPGKG